MRAALLLVLHACRQRGVPVRVVARPEIFTHGEAERWVRERLGAIAEHLCISDGSTIKTLPGCRTHVFFHHLGSLDNWVALRQLSTRAPELMGGVASQVNTALPLGRGALRVRPEPLYLTASLAVPRPAARLLAFFLNRDSPEDSANRIEQRGEVAPAEVAPHEEVLYLPLSETALHDRGFARLVGGIVAETFYRPQRLLVLRLPPVEAAPPPLAARLQALLPGLREGGVTIPRACPPNLLFATADLAEDSALLTGRRWTMLFHNSFDFWRHTEAFYRRARRVLVVAGQQAPGGFLPPDVAPLFGSRAQRLWLHDAPPP